MSSNVVLPPANGKKLWRVKRTNSGSCKSSSASSSSLTSAECLNSSLKIAAAAAAAAAAANFTVKRPPLRRPKNKPGKPKDYVFVDLSPVKSQDCVETVKASPVVQQVPSPTLSTGDCTSVEESLFDLPGSHDGGELGLGIMNLGFDWSQTQPISQETVDVTESYLSQQLYGYQQAMLQQHLQIQQLQQQLLQQQQQQQQQHHHHQQQDPPNQQQDPPHFTPKLRKRKQAAGQLQFKTYQPKHNRSISDGSIRKPSHTKRASVHEIPTPSSISSSQYIPMEYSDSTSSDVSLDDFMMLNEQIAMNLPQEQQLHPLTPASSYSSDVELFPSQNFEFEEFLSSVSHPEHYPAPPLNFAPTWT
ncbi:hypothetical protein KGF56_002321 [Candida oxycetoniae]|uniref:Uncharacterized protein n=1 Tax=Candida oxycetoniae TaxID=497107 RepID=A0AAI9SY83_9ASCO|nr:uncharacterized protein KGF56_002321 [Candida oxycetoniae]KAI3404905.2 hypothetical protein KGF56_002321 [Candida oxycetoniae]